MEIFKVKEEYVEKLSLGISYSTHNFCCICGKKLINHNTYLTTTDYIVPETTPSNEKLFAKFAEEIGSGYGTVNIGLTCFKELIEDTLQFEGGEKI